MRYLFRMRRVPIAGTERQQPEAASVGLLPSGCQVLQIVRAIIEFAAVPMVDRVAWWAWTNERSGYQPMHKMPQLLPVTGQCQPVVTPVEAWRQNITDTGMWSASLPPHAPERRHRVDTFITRNVAPLFGGGILREHATSHVVCHARGVSNHSRGHFSPLYCTKCRVITPKRTRQPMLYNYVDWSY